MSTRHFSSVSSSVPFSSSSTTSLNYFAKAAPHVNSTFLLGLILSSFLLPLNNLPLCSCRVTFLLEVQVQDLHRLFNGSVCSQVLASSPDPQPPGFIQDRRFEPVHVVLLQGVVAVVEEGELVVDLRDPRVLTVILALSYLVNLLLKLLQAFKDIGYQ